MYNNYYNKISLEDFSIVFDKYKNKNNITYIDIPEELFIECTNILCKKKSMLSILDQFRGSDEQTSMYVECKECRTKIIVEK